jgi:drug/metabolite transporter (DMT)-like permease
VSQSSRRTGMAMMATAMMLVPVLDVIAKFLMDRLSPLEVTASRFVVQTLILLPVFLLAKGKSWPNKGHVAAGGFLGLSLLIFNYALQEMPVANALAIFFIEPLVLTVLSALVLQEKISSRRFVAILVGLCGVLIILRPNVAFYGALAFYPLATACLFSCYMLVTRMMSQSGGQFTLQFWTGFFAALVLLIGLGAEFLLVPEIDGLVHVNWSELGLILGMGALATVAHQLIVQALSRIEAGVAAPYQYLEIVSAVLLGWMIFGDFPDAFTWFGTVVIVGSGIYVFVEAFGNNTK